MTGVEQAEANLVRHLRRNALSSPSKIALHFPVGAGYGHVTFLEVDRRSDAFARRFRSAGIGKGTRTLLMARLGPDLFAILFGLFKVGAVAVTVDPGMGLARMLACQRTVGAEAFVGVRVAHWICRAALGAFRSAVIVGAGAADAPPAAAEPAPFEPMAPDDLMMINFTTGATGPPKGVEYTHAMAEAMVQSVQRHYGQGPSDVSLASLPLFAFFDLLLGSTAVLPPMDPTRPADVDPRVMIEAIRSFGATLLFASPAFLHRVGEYGARHGQRLPSLRVAVCGGAPASTAVIATFRSLLGPGGRLFTSYGATEALPISAIEAGEILEETAALTRSGHGVCAGRPVPPVEACIVPISEGHLPAPGAGGRLPDGEVGEIAVRGPNVSRHYHRARDQDALTKIEDAGGTWHRTGDLGWLDAEGRLWFCGRKAHRVQTARGTAFTVQWEGVFNAHPDVYRTALVGVGGEPVICVELRAPASASGRASIEAELRALAARHPVTQGVKAFLFHRGFPVDRRHNAKIDREALAPWAASVLRGPRLPASLRAVPVALWLLLLAGLTLLLGLAWRPR